MLATTSLTSLSVSGGRPYRRTPGCAASPLKTIMSATAVVQAAKRIVMSAMRIAVPPRDRLGQDEQCEPTKFTQALSGPDLRPFLVITVPSSFRLIMHYLHLNMAHSPASHPPNGSRSRASESVQRSYP